MLKKNGVDIGTDRLEDFKARTNVGDSQMGEGVEVDGMNDEGLELEEIEEETFYATQSK
jgi:hypothetical protein